MTSYIAGLVTASAIFITIIVIYFTKNKPLQQKLNEEEAKRKLAEAYSRVLEKQIPDTANGRVDMLNKLRNGTDES
jgi:trans-aconitate methyltransferase